MRTNDSAASFQSEATNGSETAMPQPGHDHPDPSAQLMLATLEDDKAEDVLWIDLREKTDIADHMIIASGRSARHVAAIADHVLQKLKQAGLGSAKVEGLPKADWVLIDAGNVILHLFRPEVRRFYNLERIWAPEIVIEARHQDPYSGAEHDPAAMTATR
jgi:ribosome-associated protein